MRDVREQVVVTQDNSITGLNLLSSNLTRCIGHPYVLNHITPLDWKNV